MASHLWISVLSLTLSVGCAGSETDKDSDDGTIDTTTDTAGFEDSAVADTSVPEEEIFGECGDGISSRPQRNAMMDKAMPMLPMPVAQTAYYRNVVMVFWTLMKSATTTTYGY